MTREERRPSGAILALLCLLLAALSAAALKTRSYDFGWHLAAGKVQMERHQFLRADEFSFTSAGTPWADHEWLFQVLAAGLFQRIGHAGFFLIKAACAFGAAAAGWIALRSAGAGWGGAVALSAFALAGFRPRLGERPETVSLMLASLLALLLLSMARGGGRRGARLAAAALLGILWANLHAAAVVAPVLALAVAAGAWLDSRFAVVEEERRRLRGGALQCALAAPVLLAGLAVNPYGLDLLRVPSRIGRALQAANLINPEWLPPTLSGQPLFFAASAGAGALLLLGLGRRWPGAGRSMALGLAALALGVSSVRHTGLFFALLPAILAPIAASAGLAGAAAGRRLPGAAAALAAAGGMLLFPPAATTIGVGLQERRFPEASAAFLSRHLPDVRAYNDTAFGGYLIWSGWPRRQVFLDGRNEVHAALLQDLSRALDDGRRWQELLSRHGVEAALVGYRTDRIAVLDAVSGARSESSFAETHFPKSAWALVHWDDVAMLFVRRQGRFGGLAAEREYRHIRPEAALLGLGLPLDPELLKGVAEELARKKREEPDCPLAERLATLYGLAR